MALDGRDFGCVELVGAAISVTVGERGNYLGMVAGYTC